MDDTIYHVSIDKLSSTLIVHESEHDLVYLISTVCFGS